MLKPKRFGKCKASGSDEAKPKASGTEVVKTDVKRRRLVITGVAAAVVLAVGLGVAGLQLAGSTIFDGDGDNLPDKVTEAPRAMESGVHVMGVNGVKGSDSNTSSDDSSTVSGGDTSLSGDSVDGYPSDVKPVGDPSSPSAYVRSDSSNDGSSANAMTDGSDSSCINGITVAQRKAIIESNKTLKKLIGKATWINAYCFFAEDGSFWCMPYDEPQQQYTAEQVNKIGKEEITNEATCTNNGQ